MIQSYKQNPTLEEKYDTIIIGSGMGSLTCGAILAKEGQKVLVLEQHYTAGGFTHVFKRKGYEWDVGIHYIGEVGRPKSAVKKLFDYITNAELKWADMGDVYDRIIIGDKSYDFVKGTANFKAKLISYFPEEENAITEYIKLAFEANKASRKFFMEKAAPKWISNLFGGFMRKSYLKYANQTTHQVLSSLTTNQELIKVLSGQYGDYGLPPKQSSFVMHASVVRHYLSGGNFPVGGSSRIVATIDPVIESAGGIILVKAEVDEIIIKNNTAIGVKMTDGKVINANNIISGAGIITTYNKLLPKQELLKHNLKNKLQKVTPSVAHICLYIGLNGTPEELNLSKTNLWIYPDDGDHDLCVERYLNDNDAPFPLVYISFPAAKDPDWNNRYPGKSTIDVLTLMPYELVEKWENSKWMKRGNEYDIFKEKLSQRLLKILFEHEPQLVDKIDHYELSTPLTTKHFVNYDKGEIYGLDHTPKRYHQRFLQPRTPIKNLYLTGQDIVTAGVAAALFSGVLTTSAMIGKNLIKKIMAKN
ncbi:NAD(P)/FAD-dependent oxidoreductase [Flavobacteriaceae bacterium S0825]|uniref:phytoene desaturase family protein n=1 Tax=Gaetbulibacter sp. S0825 TaxID=2720084 RepID=UPI0014321D21|nr:NAD(P)/FAD-dependent oxidoreductase [Gaetbulibacter sp. S0825]MCK0107674.1 NAD(P)/FAD-dependent oxidoreductase [Flavobacteriaceae bacterium S0825]NIX63310.1 NAD(P)/FAD-dependent oxidoreductase [Gaetbulibacter sp. S0825]